MSETEAFKGNIEWLGWDAPAIELVSARLLELRKKRPDTFRRTLLVLPTAESARRLREYMALRAREEAETATAPLLMPRVMQLGHLLDETGPNVATEQETLAAWLKVLNTKGEDPVAAYAPLIPCRPEKHVARWAVGTAYKLMELRQQLEQENISCNAVTKLLEKRETEASGMATERGMTAKRAALGQEKLRWRKLGELFSRVDALLGRKPAQQAREELVLHPHWPGKSRLMIVACVPDLSPQLRRFLNNLHGTDGGEVQIWVNAPEPKPGDALFDAFGMPTTAWTTRDIDVPNALVFQDEEKKVLDGDRSTLHLVDDATALAQEAVRLAGGRTSDEVMVAVGDTAYTPAIIGAFEEKGWSLYAPEGRSLLTTDVGRLVGQLADLCAAREEFRLTDTDDGGMAELNAFVELMCNPVLQRVLRAHAAVSVGLKKLVEDLRAQLLPATTGALCRLLNPETPLPSEGNISLQNAERQRCSAYYDYAVSALAWADACCRAETLPEKLRSLADRLINVYAESSLKRPVEKLSRTLMQAADEHFVATVGKVPLLLEILRRKAEDAAKGVQNTEARHLSVGDVSGWREVPFAPEKRVILTALHDGCVPEPARGSEFLPDSLCQELGIRGSESYTARDSFLFTALMEGRRAAKNGDVHIIMARQNPDASVAAPSSLLLRCGADLPQRARLLFAEAAANHTPVSVPSLPLFRADCGGKKELLPGEMESIGLIAQGRSNPFAKTETMPDGTVRYTRTFSPSSLSLFLQCPLSFWMKHLFGLDAGDVYETDKSEPASNEYGTLMHSVLQKLVRRYPSKRMLLDAAGTENRAALEEYLAQEAEALCREEWQRCYAPARFRGAMPLPLLVQAQNMEKTVRRFARRHVADVLAGWCNLACEYQLTPTLTLEDGRQVRFRMTADRIDRHEDGSWRIIDYKTSNGDKNPWDVHFGGMAEQGDNTFHRFMNAQGYHFEPLMERTEYATNYYHWKDVQLMLYAFGLRQLDPAVFGIDASADSMASVMPQLFYYTLEGKTQSVKCHDFLNMAEDKPDMLFGLSPEALLEHAMQTVRNSIRMILDGVCLFSAESLRLKDAPFSRLRDARECKRAPRFGGISSRRDPRALFCLPALADSSEA